MKKIFTLLLLSGMFASCRVVSEEPKLAVDDTYYEAYGLLTVPSSGFTKENVRTKVVLVSDELLDIYMFDVKFATMMPVTIDMVISGVGYTQNADGIHFYGDNIVPTAGNKPYDKYIVTDLVGYISADSLCLSNNYGDTPSVYAGKLTHYPLF
ncbi:MAG: hypothetical protein IJT12_06040 [Paludibacteraceae bacterium]|nr:hypothetical protein [Paludibacteraceae bacterium]